MSKLAIVGAQFADPMLALCRCQATQHLNGRAIGDALPHIPPSARVAVVFNDPYCRDSKHPEASPGVLEAVVPAGWSIHYTRCGDFTETTRCAEGVESLFEHVLRA
jgi:hypothetical protein